MGLRPLNEDEAHKYAHKACLWFNIKHATADNGATVKRLLGIELPSLGETRDLEESERLYIEDNSVFMTATVLSISDKSVQESCLSEIIFILGGKFIITVSNDDVIDLAACKTHSYLNAEDNSCALFIGMMEAMVGRTSDILSLVSSTIDTLSPLIFGSGDNKRDFGTMLQEIGRNGELLSRIRESLVSLSRVVSFARRYAAGEKKYNKSLEIVNKDIKSLVDYSSFMAGKFNLLLDATLGLINIKQSNIIKIFTVASVIFLPPTLIASIYGMNFQHMPELALRWGYGAALALMLISAILPYCIFKYKKWL
jgi:magnesium transporter